MHSTGEARSPSRTSACCSRHRRLQAAPAYASNRSSMRGVPHLCRSLPSGHAVVRGVQAGLIKASAHKVFIHLSKHCARLIRRRAIFGKVGLDKHELRAQLLANEARHGGAHAKLARHVVGGRDHADAANCIRANAMASVHSNLEVRGIAAVKLTDDNCVPADGGAAKPCCDASIQHWRLHAQDRRHAPATGTVFSAGSSRSSTDA